MEKGKLPPQAIDLEEAVLGAAIGCNASGEIIEILRKEKVFYKPHHQAIYDAILEMYEASEEIDLLTISQALKSKGKLDAIGGDVKLIELTNKVHSSAHVEFHCRIIQQQFVKRRAIDVGNDLVAKSYNDDTDIFNLVEQSYKSLDQVSDWLFVKKPTDFKSNVDKLFESANKSEPGVPSCISKLQGKLNGYQKSNLIILAARPGMGKTALLLNEALNAARLGIPVGIFSLEMSSKELTARMFANYLSINSEAMSLNKQTPSELKLMNEKRPEFEKLPIYIHDQPSISPLELKIQASKWKREKGVQMIFVDYLQLMSEKNKSGNREQEISTISRSLKGTAKELDVPIMALSQLSRAVEIRGGSKRPLLSDLRESGAIEQDADIVMFIYRPEYYKIEEWDDDEGGPTKNQAEIIIAKFRNGKVGSCIAGCKLQYMQFFDLEEDFDYTQIKPASPDQAFEPVETVAVDNDDDDLPF